MPTNPIARAKLTQHVANMMDDPELNHVGEVMLYLLDRAFAAETAEATVRQYADRLFAAEGKIEELEAFRSETEAQRQSFEDGMTPLPLYEGSPRKWEPEPLRVLIRNGQPVDLAS